MTKTPTQPRRLTLAGRGIVNRDWIMQRTGAGRSTAAKWYADRLEQPQEFRHPEVVATIDRVKYYDEEQFETFYSWHEKQKKASLLPVDEELWAGDPDEWISINQASAWFHFADTGVIRKYVADFPEYFPKPVGTVEGPSGRQIMAFRRGDLQVHPIERTRAREVKRIDVGVASKPRCDLDCGASEDVHHPARHVARREHLGEGDRAQRRAFARHDHHGVARNQCRCDDAHKAK